ncbi:MAG TPA: hypothetical protein PKY82_00770 [Pyrinomonadaceae bacterium]|nr:hypothetical protein [Pyrinomonadaceae bacterium]
MKKITLILAHLVLIFGIITTMPTIKSPSNQVLAYSTFDQESSGDNGPDDTSKKPGSGPKEEPKNDESKSVGSTIWGWIKKILT